MVRTRCMMRASRPWHVRAWPCRGPFRGSTEEAPKIPFRAPSCWLSLAVDGTQCRPCAPGHAHHVVAHILVLANLLTKRLPSSPRERLTFSLDPSHIPFQSIGERGPVYPGRVKRGPFLVEAAKLSVNLPGDERRGLPGFRRCRSQLVLVCNNQAPIPGRSASEGNRAKCIDQY